jgi:hypothetical protein
VVIMWERERLKKAEKRFEVALKGGGSLRESPNSDQTEPKLRGPWQEEHDIRYPII